MCICIYTYIYNISHIYFENSQTFIVKKWPLTFTCLLLFRMLDFYSYKTSCIPYILSYYHCKILKNLLLSLQFIKNQMRLGTSNQIQNFNNTVLLKKKNKNGKAKKLLHYYSKYLNLLNFTKIYASVYCFIFCNFFSRLYIVLIASTACSKFIKFAFIFISISKYFLFSLLELLTCSHHLKWIFNFQIYRLYKCLYLFDTNFLF